MKQFASTTWGMAAVLVYACGSSDDVRTPSPAPPSSPQQIARAPQPPPSCPDAVPIWSDGEPAGAVCVADAAARGLTIVDLTDAWTPAVLTPPADAPPLAYR